jgi:hypothetical protein
MFAMATHWHLTKQHETTLPFMPSFFKMNFNIILLSFLGLLSGHTNVLCSYTIFSKRNDVLYVSSH